MKDGLIISKLNASRRQLETAIRLYFFEGDSVSIHTLVWASYNLLKDINKKSGGAPMIVDSMRRFIKPNWVKFFYKKLGEAGNFFKHANRDSDDVLKFRPFLTEVLLFDACSKCNELISENIPMFKVYILWFMINNSEGFNLPGEAKALAQNIATGYTQKNRKQFFEYTLPLVQLPGFASIFSRK